MTTISFRRLSDKTLQKYEALEREGKLTSRQKRALEGHRLLPLAVEAMIQNYQEEKKRLNSSY